MTDIERAEHLLNRALGDVTRELADYPGPVSGCDQQYTHLLATRTRLRNAIDALGAEIFIPTPRTLSPGAGVESR